VRGTIDITSAEVAELDDTGFQWPADVRLDNFRFGRFGGELVTFSQHFCWNDAGRRYPPQFYRQLAAVCRSAGRLDLSRDVLIAAERAKYQNLRKSPSKANRWRGRMAQALLELVGYGYHPFLVLIPMAFLVGFGGWLFEVLHSNHQIVLANNLDGTPGPGAPATTAHYHPYFSGWIYALDLLLPVVSLGQRQMWIPASGFAYLTTAFTVIGWLLATVVAVGFGTMLKRQGD
jgi:hypothetical protein